LLITGEVNVLFVKVCVPAIVTKSPVLAIPWTFVAFELCADNALDASAIALFSAADAALSA